MKQDWLANFDRIVVVSPHSDDAAFSCGGLLSDATGRGIESMILVCFAVSNYLPGTGETDPEKITEARIAEDVTYGRMLGGNCSASWLKNAEALMRKGSFDKVFGESNIDDHDRQIVTALTAGLGQFSDPGTAVFVPAGLGEHIDHLIARNAGLAAAQVSTGAYFLYEDMPYAAKYSAGDISGITRDLAAVNGFTTQPVEIGGGDFQGIKRRSAECYPSQHSDETMTAILARSGETFWTVDKREGKSNGN